MSRKRGEEEEVKQKAVNDMSGGYILDAARRTQATCRNCRQRIAVYSNRWLHLDGEHFCDVRRPEAEPDPETIVAPSANGAAE